MATNPRIEELRKRLEKEPGSRLFAQLAEELRKAGDLSEAVRVARDGLKQHPAYPSARMTLGRALLELDDLPAARMEFETVLRAAPDNLLAGRYLADCLEGLGDPAGAVARLRQTLALAPGDPGISARLAELEARGASAGGQRSVAGAADAEAPIPLVEADEESFELESASGVATPAAAAGRGTGPAAGESAARAEEPIPLVDAREEFELETSREGAAGVGAGGASERASPAADEAPIALVDVGEDFELEPSHEAPATRVGSSAGGAEERQAAAAPKPEPDEAPIPLVDADEGFELEASHEAPPTRIGSAEASPEARVDESHEDLEAGTGRLEPLRGFSDEAVERLDSEEGDVSGTPPLASVTLAELYVRQGLLAQARAVYERLLEREPHNEGLRARLRELAGPQRPPLERAGTASEPAAAVAERPAADLRERRRAALGRAIQRLERLREGARKP